MSILLIGFDSAWTRNKRGALVGALQQSDGTFQELGLPRIVNYRDAEGVILKWQSDQLATSTIVLLDQPTIVKNAAGQRPVENLVSSPVSRRRGGVQPANITREEMFGRAAPVWPFLARFGGPADPLKPLADTRVFETYPVLAMIALGWTLPDSRPAGRLPKYNPERKKTFSNSDWKHVCGLTAGAFRETGLVGMAGWIDSAARNSSPRKSEQDGLDACICLLVAVYLAQRKECLMIGDLQTGYIVVPNGVALHAELESRCTQTGRLASEWLRPFRLQVGAS